MFGGQYMSVSISFDALQAALCADLDFHGTDGSYGTHAWHPFPAKFPPQLPRFLIEQLSVSGDVVLDPMLGSGTTLIEAVRLGRRAVGCDIDPLARMVAAAKLTPIDPSAAMQTGLSVLSAAQNDCWQDDQRLQKDLELRFDGKTADFIDYWFLPQHQIELLSLIQRIEELPQGGIREFLKVVFSSTIIAKSGGVSLARDLAHTRPHRDTKKAPNSAFVEFAKRLERNIAAMAKSMPQESGESPSPSVNGAMNPSKGYWQADVRAASATDTGLPGESIDLIVTSPPYANNAIDYMRAHKFSLVWFGWKITELSKIRAQYLGHDALSSTKYQNLPDQCQETITTLAERDARKAQTLRRYFGEMATVISEMKRVLKRGRAAVIVVATSNLRGIDVQTHKGLAAIGESCGFDLAGIGVRRLDRDKRMMPARWGNQQSSQIEARMHDEYVIGLVKS
jgi:DNA modification methylase